MNPLHTIVSLLFLCICLNNYVSAYVPAHATNDTSSFENHNPGMLTLRWPPLGMYSEQVSYQLVGNATTGKNQGAIVHFTDNLKYLQNISTSTPWIALISCDDSPDNSSSPMGYDAFSSANDQGAIAALLYSETSAACVVNEEYKTPEFDRVMDIFTTTRASAARLIESQFDNVSDNYTWFNATRLTAARDAVLAFIAHDGNDMKHSPPGYLMATLAASSGNDTDPAPLPIATGTPAPDAGGNSGGGTGLAMIILYSITGCVSALFCVVIISGAIRAIRHPERYGPRAGNMADGGDGPGQTRTAGLTRAILDTFPVIKFGRTESDNVPPRQDKDVEHSAGQSPTSLEMATLATKERSDEPRSPSNPTQNTSDSPPGESAHDNVEEDNNTQPTTYSADNAQPAATESDGNSGDLVPEAIGRETCPICIVDFEIGDDLRVLPCPGKHRFHQHCVDPWLLELSSSCPICREDFAALETMVAAADTETEPAASLPISSHPSRFSRYIRFAQGRRNRSRRENIAQASTTSLPVSSGSQIENTNAQPHAHES